MLIAADKLLAPPLPATRRREVALAVSALLHAALLGLLLLRPGRALPPSPPPIEIEMIQQEARTRGAPPPPAPPPPAAAPTPPPAPTAAPSPPSPPLPSASDAPAPSPAAPAQQAAPPPRPAPPKRAAPEVNLGNGPNELDPLTVTGDNVVPPAPDARYRNLPPHYPAAAARVGAEGTVQVVARIAPDGRALAVGIVSSSGNRDLDEEARRAVALWHFRPAYVGKVAVPYDYVVNIRFALGDR